MDSELDFRRLIHKIAEGLTIENVKMMRYLCKDAIPHGMEMSTALQFFEYFESKGWISFSDMSFLAEVLYRINRHDLLKRLPGVKNRRDYEDSYFHQRTAQNFTPFRIACFQLLDELTASDFEIMRNFCKDKLSTRNYQRSVDIISLLVCLEEEDLISDDDFEFILNSLRHIDNQAPYNIFHRLRQGDITITYPKKHQSTSRLQSNNSYQPKAYYDLPLSHSMPQLVQTSSFANVPLPSPHFGNNYPSSSYQDVNRYPGSMHSFGQQTAFDGQSKYMNKSDTCDARETSRTFSEHDSAPRKNPDNTQLVVGRQSFHEAVRGPPMVNEHSTNRLCLYEADRSHLPMVNEHSTSEHCFTNHTFVKTTEPAMDNNSSEFTFHDQESNSAPLCPPISSAPGLSSHRIPEEHSLEQSFANFGFDDNDAGCGDQSAQPFIQDCADTDSPEEHMFSTISNTDQEEPIDNEVDAYPMNSVPTGICLIINNKDFESSINMEDAERRLQMNDQDYPIPNVGLKNRPGSEKDVQSVENLFKRFGFKVQKYENLDVRKMSLVITEIAKMDHNKYDCFVAIIMSHGLEGCIYGVDGKKMPTSKIWRAFIPQHCQSLVNKPKIFFFQACQGDRKMDAHSSCPRDDIEPDAPSSESVNYGTPSEADFLIGHSTVPGYMSYRSRTDGSWFIDALVSNLKKHHDKEDLLSIMIKVNDEVAQKPFKQMSMPIPTLRKKVYLRMRNDLTPSTV